MTDHPLLFPTPAAARSHRRPMRGHRLLTAVALATLLAGPGQAQTARAPVAQPVVVSGTVPDEATRNAILARMREIYGAERVVDQLGVGAVVAPPDWTGYVQKMLSPQLKQVSRGQLDIQGNNIELKGEVANEDARQKLAADLTAVLNPTYAVRNSLRVAAPDQGLLDAALANRIIEFEPGSSVLRPAGLGILNEMAVALRKLGNKKVDVIGHTDADGPRDANVTLSLARAEAVRNYLGTQGIAAAQISTSGMGPDQPVASNATPDGRARNRRIEFRVNP